MLKDRHRQPQVWHVSGLTGAAHLAKSCVLHCDLAEEKVHIVPVLNSVEEMRLCGEERRERRKREKDM